MGSTNPRDVAYKFRDYARKIHSKARPNDPSFIKIAVLAGRIEQWFETRYPSFIQVGMPIPETSEDWAPGRDTRIKQLPGPPQDVVERRARAAELERHNAGKADVSRPSAESRSVWRV